ncbi:hypothetical protein A2875_00350 [Candidatus Gottesmanbacteria bacterium RIFCSPHIGHO2_01_FULL_46_14]|uniref:Type IV pilus modification protein PilV n=2 Tax=Candidatus Gottesmaniibacteriota TaxID=1752720 RepID=A0A1F5ZL30_9BACT|nr:MAG: hypothetical protein A2875_00350 [Candidatus Gottesmanbacteria bacterium RIFCSPHIGHO2_01_FULL_46_14]OGG30128.1 MAG: hypothetical protein A2971_05350 [Candidatus Gottesmanbacteria bacterium RIFCSPLOWO2_01_FULL_46_21]
MIQNLQQRGQSLLEIIVATGVIVLLVTGLAVGTTVSLRTSQYGNRRSVAIKYAQEGIELTRSLRDRVPWDEFTAHDTNADPHIGTPTCLGSDGTYDAGPCEANLDTLYTRRVVFNWNSVDNRMEISVSVSWNQAGQTPDVTLDTYFTQWK